MTNPIMPDGARTVNYDPESIRIVYDDPEQLAVAILIHMVGGLAAAGGWFPRVTDPEESQNLCKTAREIANTFFEIQEDQVLPEPDEISTEEIILEADMPGYEASP